MNEANIIFSDLKGNRYLVRDVPGAGDCALLALLHNPAFHAPVSGVDELWSCLLPEGNPVRTALESTV